MLGLLLLLAAVICWAIGAVTGFGWFGSHLEIAKIVAWVSLGLFFYGLSALLPGFIDRTRPPA